MTKLKRNQFDLTHDVKLTLDMGNLVPILALECIPGDKHTISCESLLRFSPLIAPVMHRYDVTMHYFFVPNRLVWKDWEQFITNTKNPQTGLLPAFPYLTFEGDNSNHEIGSLADYLGIPYNLYPGTIGSRKLDVNAIPFAAYQMVFNEYYRDQNLIDEIPFQLQSGDNNPNFTQLTTLRKRAWEHDYFTACLPWAQKGQAVDIPLGDVKLKTDWTGAGGTSGQGHDLYLDPNTMSPDGKLASYDQYLANEGTTPANRPVIIDPSGYWDVGSTTINDLRRAFKLQEWLEKAARGGTRYIEYIKAMFGVTSSDKRLQRPEYITGTKSPVVISEVLNTTGIDMPQGNMSGHAVSVNSGQYGSYYCEEHGYIIGIMSVLPKPAYMQGLDRHWSKIEDPTQYYFDSFANIGEQEVKIKEITAFADAQEDTFGYIPRYAEYRFQPNRVCSNFRTDLAFWHQARRFGNPAQLNEEFVTCSPDKRIFAVEDAEINSLYAQVLNKISSIRPLPKYGTPTF